MHFIHGADKAFYVKIRRNITKDRKSKSKNFRNKNMKLREKFGIRIPNNTKEALIWDKINNDAKWQDTIETELGALKKMNVWKFYSSDHRFSSKYQRAPLILIFDVKKEDLRRKARIVVGGHVLDSSHL